MTDQNAVLECKSVIRQFREGASTLEVLSGVDLRIGPALDTLDALIAGGEQFDFAFIDADKRQYGDYFDRCLQLVPASGLIAIDNALWSGRVADAEVAGAVVDDEAGAVG